MRSLVIFCALLIVVGVSVAHYADKVLLNPNGKPNSTDAVPTRSSPSSVTVVHAPSAPPAPSPPARPPSTAAAPAKPALPEVVRMSPSSQTVTLRDNGRGYFMAEGMVEGVRVNFLIDTGAGAVGLRESTAAKLGIRPAQSEYTVKVQTANGEALAAPVQLKLIEVGGIAVRDVRALVQRDDKLQSDLLGMAFLSRIRWTHDRGRLVLQQ